MVVDDFQEIEALAELGVSAGAHALLHCLGTSMQACVCSTFLHQFTTRLMPMDPPPCCLRTLHAADVKKAKEGGFYTIQSLIMNPRKVRYSGRHGLACSCRGFVIIIHCVIAW
jgi:hypothetical protein